MIFVFITFITLYIILYLTSYKYKIFIEHLHKDIYPLKAVLPIGFLILDFIKYNYKSKYDCNTRVKLAQLSGYKNSEFFLKVFWSEKINYIFIAMIFIALVGSLSEKDTMFFTFSIILFLTGWFLPDNQIQSKIKKRKQSVQIDFPEMVLKINLLITAGLPVMNSFKRIHKESSLSFNHSPLYNELNTTISDLNKGISEVHALENFAVRLREPIFTRFISILIQHIKKGDSNINSTLRLLGNECWDIRKNTARKIGEEASAKLLLPIMLMFGSILLIVLAPVFIAFENI